MKWHRLADKLPPLKRPLLIKRGSYLLYSMRYKDDGTISYSMNVGTNWQLRNKLTASIESQQRVFPDFEWMLIADGDKPEPKQLNLRF